MNNKASAFRHPHPFLCFLLCSMLFLSGCSHAPAQKKAAGSDGSVMVGSALEVKNEDKRLTLLDNKDALAADGLYYATWTAGNSEPYENKDGDTVDLYDAQLYLLLGEAKSANDAQHDMDTWLAAAKENYEVEKEEAISCSGQDYTLLTYSCKSADTPYDRGVSAFCTNQNLAVCIELTCRASYSEDLGGMLTGFLNSCHYNTD